MGGLIEKCTVQIIFVQKYPCRSASICTYGHRTTRVFLYKNFRCRITFFFFNVPYHFSAFRVSGHLVFLPKVNFNFFVHCIKQLKGKFKQNVFKRKKRTVSIQIEFWESSRSLLLALRSEREK